MVVVVIVALVWVAVLPMLQPNQQRDGRQWLMQAQAMLTLSCDLAAQSMQTHRLLWQNGLNMQRWHLGNWETMRDVEPLNVLAGWKVVVSMTPMPAKGNEMTWLCRPDGEQTAGKLMLTKEGLGQLTLTWQGDGRYVQTKGL